MRVSYYKTIRTMYMYTCKIIAYDQTIKWSQNENDNGNVQGQFSQSVRVRQGTDRINTGLCLRLLGIVINAVCRVVSPRVTPFTTEIIQFPVHSKNTTTAISFVDRSVQTL